MQRPLIASHRGGAFLWPENSLAAFRNALALPAEQLELDVHLSADGVPMVLHDATLERTSTGTGPLRALSCAALREHKLKGTGGEPIPTLAEAVALVAGAGRGLRLELKADAEGRPYPGLLAACLPVLDAAGLRGATVLMSFQPLTVTEATAAGGFARRVLLLEAKPWRGMGPAGAIALARGCGAEEIGLAIAEPGDADAAALREAGVGLHCWGANDAVSIRRGLALGLDALTTDDPPLALALREEWLLRR